MYIRRFGPALLFATERYESFNSVFRETMIHSNRMAPSRDTARTFSQLDRVKHIASGGWWYSSQEEKYICPSSNVRDVIFMMPDYAVLLGLPNARTQPRAGELLSIHADNTLHYLLNKEP